MNGQPFFSPDTSAYVRGADLAIVRSLGSVFATDWAKDKRRIAAVEMSVSAAVFQPPLPQQVPVQRPVLAGRSIIYGGLLYLGAISSQMWLSVFLQSFISVFLAYLFIVRTLDLPFQYFLLTFFVICLISSLPFGVSYLTPDIFAGFLILGFSILATNWRRLNSFERATTAAVLLFAVLSHATHVILLGFLTAMTAVYCGILARRKFADLRPVVCIGAVCVLLALLWEGGFAFAVRRSVGAPPLRPPFLTAKLVSLLGEKPVAEICAKNIFVVCKFQDRLPLDEDSFLWSEDKRTGVFNTVDLQTQRSISGEQLRFAVAAIPGNWSHLMVGVLQDGFRQIANCGLDEYQYNLTELNFFGERMPARYFTTIKNTLAAQSHAFVAWGNVVALFTATVAVAMAVLLYLSFRDSDPSFKQASLAAAPWRAAAIIQLSGIILNAFICGGLSSVNDRYEARVMWLLPLSVIAGAFVMRHASEFPLLPDAATTANVAVVRS